MPRYACKTDDNHVEILRCLRSAGCRVRDTSAVGGGWPDLAVLRAGTVYLLEVKDGSKSPSRRRLTQAQQDFIDEGWPVFVVNNTDEALTAVGLKR